MWITAIPKRATFLARQEINRAPFSLGCRECLPMQVLLQPPNSFFRIDLLERESRFGLTFEKNDPAWFTKFGPTQAKSLDRVESKYRFSFPDLILVDLFQGREMRDCSGRMLHFRG